MKPNKLCTIFKRITRNPKNEMIIRKRDFKHFWCGFLIMCDINQLLILYLFPIFVQKLTNIFECLASTVIIFHGNRVFLEPKMGRFKLATKETIFFSKLMEYKPWNWTNTSCCSVDWRNKIQFIKCAKKNYG